MCVPLGCHPLTPALEFIEKLGKDVRKLDTVWEEDVIQMENRAKTAPKWSSFVGAKEKLTGVVQTT